MSDRERARRVKLHRWAMRAADEVNQLPTAERRGWDLGSQCDYAAEYMGHVCRCGHKPMSWDEIYAHMLSEIAKGADQ